MRGGFKDSGIALGLATLGMIAGHIIQYLSGGNHWLPDGTGGFFWFGGSYWFSRYPLWEPRK